MRAYLTGSQLKTGAIAVNETRGCEIWEDGTCICDGPSVDTGSGETASGDALSGEGVLDTGVTPSGLGSGLIEVYAESDDTPSDMDDGISVSLAYLDLLIRRANTSHCRSCTCNI